ncbi:Paraquat-inducible protein A [compost metagenome]
MNQWKEKISEIVISEINKLKLSNANEKQLKKHIEVQLDVLIDKVDEKIRESNKDTAKGKMKQFFINSFVDMKEIKEGIPDYADAMMAEMKKSGAQKQIKGMVKQKVEQYLEKTFEEQDLSRVNSIIESTGATNLETARTQLDEEIKANQFYIFKLSVILVALAVILFAMSGFNKAPVPASQFILMLIMLLALLSTGVTTPMIDLEAKISKMSFVLFDHPVLFENQVMYFQSKSIMNVFGIMIQHKDFEMKIVGILMVLFSIVFPLLKMFSSLGYYYSNKLRENKWIQFFVMKSGKWSMADVMVIAIFMAYIGFNGMISNQFEKFNNVTDELELVTTNGTALQAGFYLFFTYVVLSLFLSGFLVKRNQTSTSR